MSSRHAMMKSAFWKAQLAAGVLALSVPAMYKFALWNNDPALHRRFVFPDRDPTKDYVPKK